MKKSVHFSKESPKPVQHKFKSANKRSIESIKSIIEKAEKLLTEDIDQEEENLSKVKKKIVLDINLEKPPNPDPFPLTRISKKNYKDRYENQSSPQNKDPNYISPSRQCSSLKPSNRSSPAVKQQRTVVNQPIKNQNSNPSSQRKTLKKGKQENSGNVRYTSPRKSELSKYMPMYQVPDFIEEVGITGEVLQSYELNFDYHEAAPIKEENLGHGMKRIEYRNGDVSFVYKNGTRKTNHNGVIYSFFPNGDKLQEFPDGTTSYKYAENGAIEVEYKNGNKIIFFENGQVHHFTKDGKLRVTFPDVVIQIHDVKDTTH